MLIDAITTNQSGYRITAKITMLRMMTAAPKILSSHPFALIFPGACMFSAVFAISLTSYIRPLPVAFLDILFVTIRKIKLISVLNRPTAVPKLNCAFWIPTVYT